MDAPTYSTSWGIGYSSPYDIGYGYNPSATESQKNYYDYFFQQPAGSYTNAQAMPGQAQMPAQQSSGVDLSDIFSAGKTVSNFFGTGSSSIIPKTGTPMNTLGETFNLGLDKLTTGLTGALSPAQLGLNSWAVSAFPSVFGNLGGGIGALATGSAGGNVASLAAAEAASGLSSAGSTFTGMLGPAGVIGGLGYLGGSMLWPDKPNAAIGSGVGAGLGALGGGMLGTSIGGAAAAGGAASAAAAGATAGSWAGPIGMGVGAIAGFLGGGLLGGAFGGKKGDPSIYTKIDVPLGTEEKFSDLFQQGAWGASGAKPSSGSSIYRSLGRAAESERNKIYAEISSMEDQTMAEKLREALKTSNVTVGRGYSAGRKVQNGWGKFGWNFEITHDDFGNQLSLAKDDVRTAVQKAYANAKQSVGYTG